MSAGWLRRAVYTLAAPVLALLFALGVPCTDSVSSIYADPGDVSALSNGTIINEIDTEYYLVFGEERHQFVGMHYCPFCGRVLSRGLWNLEKKK